MAKPYDVIIAGAGPVGLMLACELALAGSSVIVLEKAVDPIDEWKVAPLGMRGLTTPSMESLYRRNLMDELFDPAARAKSMDPSPGFQMGGHFAGIMIDRRKLDISRWKYRISSPSLAPNPATLEKVQTVLAVRAESLGVKIEYGNGVEAIVSEQDDQVIVKAANGQEYSARWLVGCDGGHSVVRKAVGLQYEGSEAKITCYAVRADIANEDQLKQGFNHTDTGMYIYMRNGPLYLVDWDGGAYDRSQAPTQDHLQAVLSKITCTTDVKIKHVQLSSSFTDRAKVVSTYRKGRVLLAGDSAHIHPPFGAQGLNLGFGDAMNLGWKLAATIENEANGSTDLALLDTYEKERRAFALAVVEYTRAQVITAQPDLYGKSIMAMVKSVIETDDGANLYMDKFWGLSQRYPPDGDAHPVVGRSAPDFEFDDGTRLGSKMWSGHALLVDFLGSVELEGAIDGRKVDYLKIGAKDTRDIGALLIRPDGCVAWAVDKGETINYNMLKRALDQWFA